MNIFRLSLAGLLLATLSFPVIGQRRRAAAAPKATAPQVAPAAKPAAAEMKIALIDTAVFGDDKKGIIRFRDAVKSLEQEFKQTETDIQTLQTRIDALTEEIKKLNQASVVSPETISARQAEVERLLLERKVKQEKGQKDFERRYNEVANPISRDIGDALSKFAEQRGITLTLDVSKFMPAILTMSPGLDLTKEFIADYNSKNPGAATTPRP